MEEFDAYAPPETDVGSAAPKKKGKKKSAVSGDIAEAIERLNEHLADQNAVALDRKEAGGRLRRATIGFIGFSLLAIFAAALVLELSSMVRTSEPATFGFLVLAGFITFISVILVIVDIRFPPRDKPTAPDETLKYFFRAIAMGRLGYAWSALCPTARERSVEPPSLGEIPIGPGSFTLRATNDLKDYTQTFARPGNGQMRTMQVKRATLLREDGDVAIVEVEATFTSWPQWAQMVAIVAFVIVRALGGLAFLILYFTLRKTHNVVFRKTLIRGNNGVWYIYSPDWLETRRN